MAQAAEQDEDMEDFMETGVLEGQEIGFQSVDDAADCIHDAASDQERKADC